jgi:hypothetical protein
MKKTIIKTRKSLNLNVETLRVLSERKLALVFGASANPVCGSGQGKDGCKTIATN